MPEPAPPAADQIIDDLCDRLEAGWRAGSPPAVEELVHAAPEAVRADLFRDLIAVERDYRARAGRPLTAAEARDRFSGLGPWAVVVLDDLFGEPPAATLEVVAGPHAGRRFPLAGHATVTIGRRPGLPISVPDDPALSRVHCVIEVNAPMIRVVDLKSTHGTFVNGRRVTEQDLKDGDLVRAGGTALKVTLAGSSDPTIDHVEASSAAEVPAGPLVVPGYRLGDELGRGAMGVVYRATRDADGADAAVKTLRPAVPPTPTELARFLREATILARLDHPHVVRFTGSGSAGGVLYIVMEYVPGVDAARLVRQSGPIAPGRVLRWAGQVLDALAHAHERGFVHRDVKPANLLVLDTPAGEVVKVSDFGLARAYEATSCSGLTLANTSGGPPVYMPPEQVTDFWYARPAADQYATAATLFHLLTGRGVYDRASVPETLRRVLADDPLPLRADAPPLPDPFGPVLRRALAREPADRFPDVRAMRDALLGG